MLRLPLLLAPLVLLGMTGNWWGASPLIPVPPYVGAAGLAPWCLGLGLPPLSPRARQARWSAHRHRYLAGGWGECCLALAFWRFRYLPPGANSQAMLTVWRDAAFGASIVAVALLGEIALRGARRSALIPLKPRPRGRIVIAPGTFIPCDGIVCDGSSEVQDPVGSDDVFPIVVKAGARIHAGAAMVTAR
ncbi:MAG: hypothetical protein IPK59_01655 [Rhodospirillaceae bacterium]|nr:hypothetical protein [Rhodospirillaceae bacterium]